MRIRHPFALAVIVGLGAARVLAGQSISIEPRLARLDQPVRIAITGLRPRQGVVVRAARTDSAGRPWRAYASAYADARGVIDLSRSAPIFGSYDGVQPMGLVTSLNVGGESHGRVRYPFSWRDTLRTVITLEVDGRVVDTDTLAQASLVTGIRVQPVRDSGLIGTLVTPDDQATHPAVLVLGGSEGGLNSEDVAAQLAAQGYAALALAYFGADSLPPVLADIPLEYFDRALRWMRQQRFVDRNRTAILATSKGAEAALLVAAADAAVRAVVAYAPSHVAWSCICSDVRSSWSRAGQAVANVPAGTHPLYRPPAGWAVRPTVNYLARLDDTAAARRAEIPVERIRGPLLLIAGGDDGLWPSLAMARHIVERRRRSGVKFSDELLAYPNAGHLIGKSFLPNGSTLIGNGRIETGGTPAANAIAQADAWPKVLAFLSRILRK